MCPELSFLINTNFRWSCTSVHTSSAAGAGCCWEKQGWIHCWLLWCALFPPFFHAFIILLLCFSLTMFISFFLLVWFLNNIQGDYNDIVGGWKAKLIRTTSGEQKWGLFIAKKNWSLNYCLVPLFKLVLSYVFGTASHGGLLFLADGISRHIYVMHIFFMKFLMVIIRWTCLRNILRFALELSC